MGGLAGEAEEMALDAERAQHDARRLVHRLEDGALLDVQLEVRPGVPRLERAVGVEHPVDLDAVLAERVWQPRAGLVGQSTDVIDAQASAGRRRPQQASPEARAFLVGP